MSEDVAISSDRYLIDDCITLSKTRRLFPTLLSETRELVRMVLELDVLSS